MDNLTILWRVCALLILVQSFLILVRGHAHVTFKSFRDQNPHLFPKNRNGEISVRHSLESLITVVWLMVIGAWMLISTFDTPSSLATPNSYSVNIK